VALLRPLRGYIQRITDRTDDEAQAAGLTVEVLASGLRRYRDPRLDQLAAHRDARRADQYARVRSGSAHNATTWSTPTLTTAGWSR
jgi:hypothetical protein